VPTTVLGGIIFSVTPTICVGLIFWFAMRAILRADRTERKVYTRMEAEERAKFEANRAEAAKAEETRTKRTLTADHATADTL
jgi:hypothetical protein